MEKEYPFYVRVWAEIPDHGHDWVWIGTNYDPNEYDFDCCLEDDDLFEEEFDKRAPEEICFESKDEFWGFVRDVLQEQDSIFRGMKEFKGDNVHFDIFASLVNEDGTIGDAEEVMLLFPEYVEDGVLFGTMNILPVYNWDDIKVQIKNWE